MPPSRGPQLRSIHLVAQFKPPSARHSNFSSRLYSTRFTAATTHQYLHPWRASTFGPNLRFQNARISTALPLAFRRNQSTSATSTAIPSALPSSTSLPAESSDGLIQNIGDITSTPDFTAIPEGLGYFKALGLDFSWYHPSAPIEWILEHIYVFTGLPWWGAIVATAVFARLSFFPLAMKQSSMMARLQAFQPVVNELREKQKEAARRGDSRAAREALLEIRQSMVLAGVNPTWIYLPMLGQAILGFGAFRLMRLGAQLPVPSWEYGGFGWVTDLTVADPFYVLPIIGGAVLALATRMGGETGAHQQISSIMRPILYWGAPLIFVAFSSFQPAAFQLTMLVTVLFGVVQGQLFKNEAFRAWAGLHPIIKPNQQGVIDPTGMMFGTPDAGNQQASPSRLNVAAAYQPPNQTPKKKGVMGALKNWANEAGKEAEDKFGHYLNKDKGLGAMGNRNKKFVKAAESYERKRRRELEADKKFRGR